MAWEIKPHTKAKHVVLKNYLNSWFPIMSFTYPKIVYIDGFAGPGRYEGGEDGSPVYALKIAKELYFNPTYHKRIKDNSFVFLFIEKNKSYFESLKKEIDELSLPDNFIVHVENGDFGDIMTEFFSDYKEKNFRLAPTFAFIDPFGTKGVPFELIKNIMSFRSCEVFFNHMYSGVMRSRNVSDHTELYGTDKWKNCTNPEDYRNLYISQLEEAAGSEFTKAFNVRARTNAPIFDLVYATNNIRGLEKMKEAMWKADRNGNFTFRDISTPGQEVLFELEPDLSPLKRMLFEEFSKKAVTIEEIERFVLINTPYIKGHIKRKTLDPLNKEKLISIIRPAGKKSGYPAGTIVHFS